MHYSKASTVLDNGTSNSKITQTEICKHQLCMDKSKNDLQITMSKQHQTSLVEAKKN